MNELSIIQKYPEEKYNLLGNTSIMTDIPDIKSPVIQVIQLDVREGKGDVYIHQHAKKAWTDRQNNYHPETPDLYAITKNGLRKLADGAGIEMLSSEHVIPSTCQKCVAVNSHGSRTVQCGNCRNRDVAYRVTIAVPQLTGEVLTVEDTHEIIADNVLPGMTDKQRAEFLKHMPQICEAKALNGAIRTALHIKGTYKLEELKKPFVVAYLVPNLNHDEVKKAAIENMFHSTKRLFGNIPSIQQIESRVPQNAAVEASDGEVFDQYIDDTYKSGESESGSYNDLNRQDVSQPVEDRRRDFCCDKCGTVIVKKVWDFSMEHFGRPLCYKCQKIVKGEGR